MTLSKVSIIAVCGLQLLVAGCKEEPTQPPPPGQKVELVNSKGEVRTVVLLPDSGTVTGTNGETILATSQITSAILDGEVLYPRVASVNSSIPGQARSNGAVAAPAARKVESVSSNATYDWHLGNTLVNGTKAGTNVAVSIRPRITGVARELAPTNQPAR